MAQAKVTLQISPVELAMIQEALTEYVANLDEQEADNSVKYRKMVSRNILEEIGLFIPDGYGPKEENNQLSFDDLAEAEEAEEAEEATDENDAS